MVVSFDNTGLTGPKFIAANALETQLKACFVLHIYVLCVQL